MTAPRTSRTTRITRWLVSGVVVLALITFIPQLSLFLPSIMLPN